MRVYVHHRFLLSCCFLLMLTPGLSAQHPQTSATWRLKRGVQLRVGPDAFIYSEEGNGALSISIPTGSITSVCYDDSTHARGPSVWEVTEAMGSTSEGLILAPFVLPAIAGVHASKSRRHFIVLNWTAEQSGETRFSSLTLEAQKSNYAQMLKQIQQVTGKAWTDTAARRREIYSRMDRQWKAAKRDKQAISLELKERTKIGNSVLDPYSYRAALRGNSTSEGNLYIFAGQKRDTRLVAVVHVLTKDEMNPVVDAVAVYLPDAKSPRQASEIRMPDRTLVISAPQPYEYDRECPALP